MKKILVLLIIVLFPFLTGCVGVPAYGGMGYGGGYGGGYYGGQGYYGGGAVVNPGGYYGGVGYGGAGYVTPKQIRLQQQQWNTHQRRAQRRWYQNSTRGLPPGRTGNGCGPRTGVYCPQ